MSDSDVEEIYDRAGISENRVGYGDRPAVIVIDVQKGFTDPECRLGGDLSSMVQKASELVDEAHDTDVPIIFTRCVTTHPEGADFGIWLKKFPTLDVLVEGTKWVEIDDRLDVHGTDHVMDKRQASAFEGTELNSMLTNWQIDTTLLVGCTTSGCVRATAIDACANGYHTIVAEEGVADRAQEPHDANLFDLSAKYADVRPMEEVIKYCKGQATKQSSPS